MIVRTSLTFLLLCTAGIAALADSVTPPVESYMTEAKADLLLAAQEHVFNDRFTQADSIYRAYIETYPNDPGGHLFRAAGLMAEMSDREEELHSDLFKALLDTAEQHAEAAVDTSDDRYAAWMHLMLGHITAQRSLWESRFGSLLKAVRMGLTADNKYEAGLDRDSTLIDIYAGLGSYHYWKSAKAGVLSLIGIFRNQKDKGIDELRRATDSSMIHGEIAGSALIWVWLDRKELDSTIATARHYAERYPDGKTFLWPMAQAYYHQQRYDSALAVYSRIRAKLLDNPGNYFNLVEVDFYITKCQVWLEDDEAATTSAAIMEEYRSDIPDETLHRQGSKIRYLEKMAAR